MLRRLSSEAQGQGIHCRAASILSLVPSIIMVEGGFVMVILGLLFYIFRTNRMAQIIVLAVISVIAYLFDPTTVQ